MTNDSTAVDFGINLLESEIDDVIFRTNEFLTSETLIGSQGPFWYLLVVSEILPFIILTNRFKSATCKILHHETKF